MKRVIDGRHMYDTDMMRIIAALFVVMIHCASVSSFTGIFYNSISHFSVPAFVMISGYYTLQGNASNGYFLKKCCNLFFCMIAWGGVYYVYNLLFRNMAYAGIKNLVKNLLTEPIHLWYLYAIISLYLFTPLLRVFHRNASRKEYHYALSLCFIFGSVIKIILSSECIPIIGTIIDKMKTPYTLGFVFLYLLGGYLSKFELSKVQIRCIYVFAVAGTIMTVVGTVLLTKAAYHAELFLSFFAPNSLAAGVGVFVFIRQMCLRFPIKSERAKHTLKTAAGCTLGIYLMHPLVIMVAEDYFGAFFSSMRSVFSIPLKTLIAFSISMALVYVYKKTIYSALHKGKR